MNSRAAKAPNESNHSYSFWAPDPAELTPLVVDSPHSSLVVPDGADFIAPEWALLTAVDAFVDELWAQVPVLGGQLLCAQFHRCFIDVNRSELDIDQSMLATPWPTLTQASDKSKRGLGLIRRFALPGLPMYDRPLTVAEVQHRLRTFYMPYQNRLKAAMDIAHARFGHVWHINAHSMKSMGNAMNEDVGEQRPDIVVSDAMGTSADPAHTEWIAHWWEEAGYHVNINHPYRGGAIVRRMGHPSEQRHSIQIEMNRKLYMNEATFQKSAGFGSLAANVGKFLKALNDYVLGEIRSSPRADRALI